MGLKGKSVAWLALALALAISGASCSGTATNSSSPAVTATAYAHPPGRRDAALAYDPQTRRLIMFGGVSNSVTGINDTWAWDGKGWTDLHPRTAPAGFYFFMANDVATQQLVLFVPDPTGLTTWSWTKGDWMKLGTYAPFGINSLTYDADLNKVVALAPGGLTYTWDGSLLQPLPTPHRVGSFLCCLTYDSETRQTLYIGNSGKFGEINQTWIFDGSDWQLSAAATPSGTDVRTVDDPAMSSVLIVGGAVQAAGSSATWTWDGTSWHRLNIPSPPVGSGASIAYDAATKEVVLFGGIDAFGQGVSDTWTWDGQTWRKR